MLVPLAAVVGATAVAAHENGADLLLAAGTGFAACCAQLARVVSQLGGASSPRRSRNRAPRLIAAAQEMPRVHVAATAALLAAGFLSAAVVATRVDYRLLVLVVIAFAVASVAAFGPVVPTPQRTRAVLAFLCFGILETCFAVYVQEQWVTPLAFACSLMAGAFAAAVALLDEARDGSVTARPSVVVSDMPAGRRRARRRRFTGTEDLARWILVGLLLAAFEAALLAVLLGLAPPAVLVLLAAAPLAVVVVRRVEVRGLRVTAGDVALCAVLGLVGSILFAAGLLLQS